MALPGTTSGSLRDYPTPTPMPVVGAGVASQPLRDPSPPTGPLGALWSLIQGVSSPALASARTQVGNYNTQLGALLANQQNQSGLINQQQGIDFARLGIQGDQLEIQQGALNRALGLAPQNEALTQKQFGLNKEDIAASADQARFNAMRQQQGLTSAATARGANVTQGYREDQGAINTQLGFTLGGIGRQGQRLDVSKQQHALDYGEQQAQLRDQQKNLGLVAKGLGLSHQEVETRTQNALNQLGLSTAISTGDIYNAIIQAQTGAFSPITQLLPMISQLSGITIPGA